MGEASWLHFERGAAAYAGSRPPYPAALFDVLRAERVIGPGVRVLEVGAGAGLATRELVAAGSDVVALEPGPDLAAILQREVPDASVVVSRLEDARLDDGAFDAVVAATSLHWVDLSVGLPLLHRSLRPSGSLAVFRHRFGDDEGRTDFRDRVAEIVARRPPATAGARSDERPTMAELSGAGFEPVRSERWRWSVELSAEQVRRLFGTFSDWTSDEVDAAGDAAEACGGRVVEHYQSVLHLLRRA
jgi:SAM-dependent methyltransferase